MKERRKHKRLRIKLSVRCKPVGTSDERVRTGSTLDASPGGLRVEIPNSNFLPGQLLSVEMTVPPTSGLLEYGGKFDTHARIKRIESPATVHDLKSRRQVIAIEFCHAPKLRV